ncbi:MAG TPA: HAD-IIIA family hydrolase [Thermoanaerobaculia bacterium]|nr:HAD-IIIA family hydrolase [Thermoanaerobaculia bacterium]
MNKALFLDRDGVLDDLTHHENGEWGAPLRPETVHVLPDAADAVKRAAEAGWLIFVVSNQPDAAKGKTTFALQHAVHDELLRQLGEVPIREFFYCFHQSSDGCSCRKPSPYFVIQAARRYGVDLGQSWFVGDVDTDVECGRRAGCRTALLEYPHSRSRRGTQRPDWVCRDLDHFVRALTAQTSPDDTRSED